MAHVAMVPNSIADLYGCSSIWTGSVITQENKKSVIAPTPVCEAGPEDGMLFDSIPVTPTKLMGILDPPHLRYKTRTTNADELFDIGDIYLPFWDEVCGQPGDLSLEHADIDSILCQYPGSFTVDTPKQTECLLPLEEPDTPKQTVGLLPLDEIDADLICLEDLTSDDYADNHEFQKVLCQKTCRNMATAEDNAVELAILEMVYETPGLMGEWSHGPCHIAYFGKETGPNERRLYAYYKGMTLIIALLRAVTRVTRWSFVESLLTENSMVGSAGFLETRTIAIPMEDDYIVSRNVIFVAEIPNY